MPTFILLTRLLPQALRKPLAFEAVERRVSQAVVENCPGLEWLSSHALLGPWDYLDVIRAPDLETATRASLLVRSYGQAHTEIWPAMPWADFKAMTRALAGGA